MGEKIMTNSKEKKEYEEYSYYDGISPELKAKLDKMTLEELEKSIEDEKEKCEKMTHW